VQQKMLYVGIDYHKNYSYATKMNERGEILEQLKFMNDSESINEFANTLKEDSKLVMSRPLNSLDSLY